MNGTGEPAATSVPARLSLCMIVRDCEETLAAALASARPFMDEIVVVDTGSRDGTRDVAQRFGVRLFEFGWCDDFSAARNYSLDQATGDWIFWMDADDVLPEKSGRELRRLIAEHPKKNVAFWVAVEQESVAADGQKRIRSHGHLKLFPRDDRLRFRYRVHEQIAPALQQLGIPFKPSRAKVVHQHADLSAEGKLRRIDRNLRLLRLNLAETPDDPVLLLHLGLTCLDLPGELPQATEALQRSLTLFERGATVRLTAYLALAKTHHCAGRPDEELQTSEQALHEFPDDVTMLLHVGRLCELRNLRERAAECYRTLLRSGKLHVSVPHSTDWRAEAERRLASLSQEPHS